MSVDSGEADLRSGILKCIDSGLGVLGDVSKQLVYSYLAQNQLSREAIPDEPWKFTEALKNLFGRGEEVLEKTIVLELKRTYGIVSSGGMLVEILAAMRLKRAPSTIHQEPKERALKPRKPTRPGMV
jgi:hypothetical protein